MTDKTLRTSEEAVQRMEALCKRLAKRAGQYTPPSFVEEARAIVAMLPDLDPDIVEARQAAAQFYKGVPLAQFIRGDHDNTTAVKAHLAGIKRGRELASQENNND